MQTERSDLGSVTSLPEQVASEPSSVASASPVMNSLLLPENDKNNKIYTLKHE